MAMIAMTASYTRRVHTSGVITPSGGLVTITTPAAGIVGRASTEGQKVSAGQVLYVIDRDANSVDGPTQQQVISALIAQRVALQREYSMRQSIAEVQRQSLANEMANLAVQHDRLTQQLENSDKVLPVMRTAMDRLRVASSQHVVTDSQYQGQIFAFTELLGQHVQFQQTALAIEGKMADIGAKIATSDNDLAKDLSQIDRNISQLTQQIAEQQAKREIKILAPIAGTLTAVRAYPGQTVAQGAPLVTLLPAMYPWKPISMSIAHRLALFVRTHTSSFATPRFRFSGSVSMKVKSRRSHALLCAHHQTKRNHLRERRKRDATALSLHHACPMSSTTIYTGR